MGRAEVVPGPAPDRIAPVVQATNGLQTMNPAYFALVMATGIVSIACLLLGMPALARILLWLNTACFILIGALTVARVILFRAAVLADLTSHARAVGFFTTAAATCVSGSQWFVVGNNRPIALGLWFAGIVLWATLTYTILTVLTVKREKPSLERGISGGWLLSVVAAQSLAVLGAQLSRGFGDRAPVVLFFCLAMWLGGGMLYIWIISLIFYRYTFMAMEPSDLAPPYWINMGAVAISTLAGSMLVMAAPESPTVRELLPFIKGLTLMFWSTATWWIPMLLILGGWRHLYRRFPLRYDPLYWGAVFPLGMYTVCTYRLAEALDTPFLLAIPRVFIYVALAAWAAAAFGLLKEGMRAARPR